MTLLGAVGLFTFICAIIVGVSSQATSLVAFQPTLSHASLPTLTPTPLPTLTPTTSPMQGAATPLPIAPVDAPASPASPVLVAAQPNPVAGQPASSAFAPARTPPAAVSRAPLAVPLTSTVTAIASPVTPRSALTPTVTATPTAVSPSPTPIRTAANWSFSGVTNRASDAGEGLVLMGELVNGTGAPQQAIAISGAFYGGQGEVAVEPQNVVSYVPIDPVPPNAHVPFALTVNGSQSIDRFDLRALSEPASETPRQDFQLSAVEQWLGNASGYCIRGQVDNQGPPLQEYLIVLAIGYDDRGSMVNFGEYYADKLPGRGAPGATFELCLDPLGGQISRHDLRVFGY